MTWSYVPPAGDPPVFAEVKDHVRFLLGDRVQSWWSPGDEEVDMSRAAWNVTYPSDQDNPEGIASVMAVAIADWVSVSGVVTSKAVGNSSLSRQYGDLPSAFRRMAMRLGTASGHAIPGATLSGFGLASREQTGRLFTLGQFDNGTSQRPPLEIV